MRRHGSKLARWAGEGVGEGLLACLSAKLGNRCFDNSATGEVYRRPLSRFFCLLPFLLPDHTSTQTHASYAHTNSVRGMQKNASLPYLIILPLSVLTLRRERVDLLRSEQFIYWRCRTVADYLVLFPKAWRISPRGVRVSYLGVTR